MLEYNEQTENLMEIAMMLEQLKGESEYLFEVLTDIDSISENLHRSRSAEEESWYCMIRWMARREN